MHGLLRTCAVLATTFGCVAPAPPATQGDSAASAKSAGRETETDTGKGSIPKRCARGARFKHECLPPPGWVRRLCADVYPEVALHMFRPDTPWKRLYMTANAEPYNASGGASLLGDKLRRGEEVLALYRRAGDTGVQVGDTAGYDILRLNGACATIHDGDFTSDKPKSVRYSKLEWRRLPLPFRNVFEAQPDISAAYEARRKACKGQSIGIVADDCERNDAQLDQEIVRYVLGGGSLPKPEKMP